MAKLGYLLELYSEKCGIEKCENVAGINIFKQFMPSRNVGSDTSKYSVVPKGYFAFNLMHVGRDEKIPVALNDTDNELVVSPAYCVFKVTDENLMLKEYLYMLMQSSEFDRYAWFCTDSSIRGNLDWERFCDIEITLPTLETQHHFVTVYKALLANQRAYEKGLEDLKLTCDAYIDQFKKTTPRVAIGDLLKEIDNRNRDESITNVQGININKIFIKSVANLDDTDLSKYKKISKGQFAYSAMQTGRDECIRIALYGEKEPCVISPAYSVLEVKNENVLSEFLMLWFMRKESDRYGWFISDSSIRASLELQRFYEIQIPIPKIEVQQNIVDIYNAYIKRREINERLKQQIKDICPILIRGSIKK